MEQCFRIVLWMFFLIGNLQASPVRKDELIDLGPELLIESISCGDRVNFTLPTSVQKHCSDTAALETIKEGLKQAKQNCTGEPQRLDNALEIVEDISVVPQPTNTTDCKWENVGSSNQFANFVNDSQNLIQRLNTRGAIKN